MREREGESEHTRGHAGEGRRRRRERESARVSELRGSSEADVIIDRLLLNCTRWRHHRTRHNVDGTGGELKERPEGGTNVGDGG